MKQTPMLTHPLRWLQRTRISPDSSITHGILETGLQGTVVAASKHGRRRPVWSEVPP